MNDLPKKVWIGERGTLAVWGSIRAIRVDPKTVILNDGKPLPAVNAIDYCFRRNTGGSPPEVLLYQDQKYQPK
jgi:hypothetical protein